MSDKKIEPCVKLGMNIIKHLLCKLIRNYLNTGITK